MKKTVIIITAIVLALVVIVAVGGYVTARAVAPQVERMAGGERWMQDGNWQPGGMMSSDEVYPGDCNCGQGGMGRQGMRGGGYGNAGGRGDGQGLLVSYMQSALAEAFGLTVDELQARNEADETLWDLAAEQGLTAEEFQAKMEGARASAIEQALADGVITQEQADWMQERQGGFGSRGGGRHGFGAGCDFADDVEETQP